MPITFTGLHHAGVLVTDVERAAAFYEQVLGLENLTRPDFGFPGRWYDLKNGHQLHLLGTEEIPSHSTNLPRFDRFKNVCVACVRRIAAAKMSKVRIGRGMAGISRGLRQGTPVWRR